MEVRRGTVGNGGNTTLTVFRDMPVVRGIPVNWRCPVLNKADNMDRLILAQQLHVYHFCRPLQHMTCHIEILQC